MMIQKMSLAEYQQLCKETAKTFDTKKTEILTWGLGIAGEAGDVASCIKKTFAHDNDQRQGIRENLGDTMWYVAMICNFFGWNLQDVLAENIDKLRKRFPQGFVVHQAKRNGNRIDWSED
jgi:NTP pyrophosphatase (non-canonical NTP hydrolase)